MSDGQPNVEGQDEGPYVSQIDSLFAQAWNEVHSEEDPAAVVEGAGAPGSAAGTAEASAAAGEGAAAGSAATGAQDAGALPTAGDPGVGGTGEPADPAAAGAESGNVRTATGADGVGSFKSSEAVALFAPARLAMEDRMEQAFQAAAIKEIQADIDPEFLSHLRQPPMRLVNMEVPSIRIGAAAGEMTRLLDSGMAAEWQKGVAEMIESEIADIAAQKADAIRPTMRVIQESFLMFENNPDIVPGTDSFDPELAARFVEIAKTYELKVNGKVLGYQDINVQPLLNSLRTDLAKQRGATGARDTDRAAAQRAAAAAQPRTDGGQFDAPQGGVIASAGRSGDSEEGFDTFWNTLKINPNGLGI